MSEATPLPPELAALFPPGMSTGRVLSVALPPGRTVTSDETLDERPVYWLSDDPPPPGLWARLRRDHVQSGLWPLLLGGADFDPALPWEEGEVFPDDVSDPGSHDPETLFVGWWDEYTRNIEDDEALTDEELYDVTAPYGFRWPGLAQAPAPQGDPDVEADGFADRLLAEIPGIRLGLVAAGRGADALSLMGWAGPVNYCDDTAKVAAVVRSWEERFAARVVGLDGHATLLLSVAAPPMTTEHAQHVAAEHFALCPDNIWQGPHPNTLVRYAKSLVGQRHWSFWWD